MKKDENEILNSYISGKCSKQDFFEVNKLFQKESSKELQYTMKDFWESSKDNQPLSIRMANLLLELSEKTFEGKKNKRRSALILFQKIAAVLIIPLLIASFWFFIKPSNQNSIATTTLVSPMGGRTQFTLPDGTTGWLNNGSSLHYPTDFKKRQVKLQGEAYFEVTHINKENFIVNTQDLSVEVLGTKFNVSAYEDDHEVSVILNEGKVKICNEKASISEILNPNEQFELDRPKSQGTISKVNSNDYIAWKDGYLKFRGETFSRVVHKIERWYNVEIEVSDEQLQNFKYRGTFKNERLDEILRLISLTVPLSYTINDRKTDKYGNYLKQKIIIKMQE